jgi:hypothetical protein
MAQLSVAAEDAVTRTRQKLAEIAKKSFPNIKGHKLHVKTLDSKDSFFQARYSIWRYTTFQPMRHLVYVNPKAFELDLSENAFEAVLAHELAHVDYYTRKNRAQLLGLIRLANPSARIGFERKADLLAISKGYGEGLVEYRTWLYKNTAQKNVSAKKRVYFSPDEIRLIMTVLTSRPGLLEKWKKSVPKNIGEIRIDSRK